MRTRPLHRWLIWLLPLIVARAFVPAGFMVAFGADGLELTLCSGSGSIARTAPQHPPDADGQHHEGHDHHAHHAAAVAQDAIAKHASHGEQDASVSHENVLCPFAVAGTSSAAVADFVAANWLPASSTVVAHRLAPHPPSVAVLIDRIRGPPLV